MGIEQCLSIVGAGAATALGIRVGMGWYATRLVRRALKNGTPGHAVYGLARAFGFVVGAFVALSTAILSKTVHSATSVAGAAACLGVLLAVWWIYRVFSHQSLRVLGEVRGSEWNNRFNPGLAALLQGPLLSVPIAGCAVALVMHLFADAVGLRVVPLTAAMCIYPGLLLCELHQRWIARRILRDPEQIPEDVSHRIESVLGLGSTRSMAVLPTGGAAFYNAIAINAVSPFTIWISKPLLQALSPDEAAAVLVHETSHVNRRDDLRRLATAISIHAMILGLTVPWHAVTLPLSCLFFVIAYFTAIGMLGQRHELIADAKAADVGLGEAMGRALVILHRLNAVPRRTGSEKFATHPLLEKRLGALGIAVPEPTAEEAPLPRGGTISHRAVGWLVGLGVAAVIASVLWRFLRPD